MIKRVVPFKSTADLLADKINDFIKNELGGGEHVMDIKYMEDGRRYVRGENGKMETETFVTVNVHVRGVEENEL
jgi:hypothetical protein|nr:MAG TPA: Sporulation protein Cse60 [Caudoviricetes sp.]